MAHERLYEKVVLYKIQTIIRNLIFPNGFSWLLLITAVRIKVVNRKYGNGAVNQENI